MIRTGLNLGLLCQFQNWDPSKLSPYNDKVELSPVQWSSGVQLLDCRHDLQISKNGERDGTLTKINSKNQWQLFEGITLNEANKLQYFCNHIPKKIQFPDSSCGRQTGTLKIKYYKGWAKTKFSYDYDQGHVISSDFDDMLSTSMDGSSKIKPYFQPEQEHSERPSSYKPSTFIMRHGLCHNSENVCVVNKNTMAKITKAWFENYECGASVVELVALNSDHKRSTHNVRYVNTMEAIKAGIQQKCKGVKIWENPIITSQRNMANLGAIEDSLKEKVFDRIKENVEYDRIFILRATVMAGLLPETGNQFFKSWPALVSAINEQKLNVHCRIYNLRDNFKSAYQYQSVFQVLRSKSDNVQCVNTFSIETFELLPEDMRPDTVKYNTLECENHKFGEIPNLQQICAEETTSWKGIFGLLLEDMRPDTLKYNTCEKHKIGEIPN